MPQQITPTPAGTHVDLMVSVTLGLASIGLIYWVYRKQRRSSKLKCILVTQGPLLSIREEAERKVRVLYGDREIKDAKLLVLRILNNGTEPIVATDFVAPLRLDFGQGSEVLSAGILETSPKGLQPAITTGGQGLTLWPILLNQGDSISVKCIVEGGADKPEVEGRIVGVHEIEWSILADQKSARENFLMGSGAAVGFVAAVALQFLPVGRGIHGLTRLLAPVMGLAMGAGIGQFIHNWITVLEAWSRWVRQLK